MWMRLLVPVFLIALAGPCRADDKDIVNIGDGIASYRLSAQYCHWPIPENLDNVLKGDEMHFKMRNPNAFAKGVREGAERFRMLTHSQIDYCAEIKDSRNSM